jgi:hypothetical protein
MVILFPYGQRNELLEMADVTGGRNGIQNHLLGKTLSGLRRPIRLDSSRIRRQLVSLARAEKRMVVSGPPQIFRKPS